MSITRYACSVCYRWKFALASAAICIGFLAASAPSALAAIPSAGLVGYWKLDETSGMTAVNSTGTSYNGSLNRTPTWTPGKVNNGLSFNGTDYVQIGNITQINNVSKVTLSAWIKLASTGSSVLIGKQASGNDIAIEATGGLVYFQTSKGSWAYGTTSLNDTAWHFVTLVFDGAKTGNSQRLKGYVDGVERTLSYSGTVGTVTTNNTTAFRLGRVMSEYSNGMIDEVTLYAGALTVAEIQQLYTNGTAQDTQAPTVPTGLSATPVSMTQINITWTSSTDNIAVTGYKIFRNGIQIATSTATTYQNTGLAPNTTYAYAVAAFDAAGNVSAQCTSTIVTTFADTSPPTVSVTAPTNGATLAGSIQITASASDDIGVVGVTFFVDGVQVGMEDTSSPYSINWNTSSVGDSPHDLTAVARDAAENSTTSETVSITVLNTNPVVTLTATPSTVVSGQTTALDWSSTNAATCAASGGWSGGKPISGSQVSGSLTSNTTFTLTCTGASGLIGLASATVIVTQPPDITPPTVSITAPTDGAAVAGTVSISASASDNVGVAGVQFYLDDNQLGAEDTNAPYSIDWDTTLAAEGPHLLYAIARDAADNRTTSASVGVAVLNTNPVVTLTATPSTIESGQTTTLDWSSTDAVTCAASGGWSGSRTTAGSETSAALSSNTTFTLTCTGASGLIGSASASVTVTQPPDITPPSISVTAPTNGATLAGSIQITASASDDIGVVGVTFFVDGVQVGMEDTSSPYSINWNTSSVGDSPHDLTAVARDAAENSTTSETVSITVLNTNPVVTLTATPSTVVSGQTTALDWSSTNAATCVASGGWSGAKAISGSETSSVLTVNTTFTLACTGASGLLGSASVTVTVTPPPDTQAPTVPSNATGTALSTQNISLSWTASTDNVGVTGYKVFRDSAQIATTTATSLEDSGLAASTTYAYEISAFDAAGNVSSPCSSVSVTTRATSTSIFPLRISTDGRHILDASGQPILINADSPWSLMVGPTKAEAETYLENRRQQGFNGVLVNLVEHKYNGPTNAEGQNPFLVTGDFSTPNDQYFSLVDWIISKAAEKGIAVFLAPAYLGYSGGDEGWYQEILANGDQKMYQYGRYIGNRYKNYKNIVWVAGGDFGPNNAITEIDAMIRGIQETAGPQIFTAHCHPGNSAIDSYPGEAWLNLNTTYSLATEYGAQLSLDNYTRTDIIMPSVYIEGSYENEGNLVDSRTEAYWAFLNGGAGHFFGNSPIWSWSAGWENELNSPGAHQMQLMRQLFESRRWDLLIPDISHAVLTSGYGSPSNHTYAGTARTSDGGTVIVYTPAQRALTINMTQISGTSSRAWWFNPQNGTTTLIGIFSTTGTHIFTPSASGDWVLVLDNAALNLPAPGGSSPPPPPTDTIPPSIPTNLAASNVTATSLTLSWTSSTDNIGVAGYQISRNGIQIGTSPTASYADSGLAASTTYAYTVASYDAANNVSAASQPLNVTTPTTTEILPDSLVAHWSFDQGSGTTVQNEVGPNYTGTFSGTPTWVTGHKNGGIALDGQDYIQIGNITDTNNVPKATLAAWIKRTAANGMVLIGKQTAGNDLAIEVYDDGRIYFDASNGSWADAYITLNDTSWHHVALVFDGTQTGNANRLKVYVDGVPVTPTYEGTVPASTTSNATPFRIGMIQSEYSNGLADEVYVYSRALSAGEIQTLASQ